MFVLFLFVNVACDIWLEVPQLTFTVSGTEGFCAGWQPSMYGLNVKIDN